MNVGATSRPSQFTLRTLLLATFVVAVVVANWRHVMVASVFFWPTVIAVVTVSFILGRQTRSAILPESSGMLRRSIAWLSFLAFLGLSGAMLWTRFRWYAAFDDSLWPRSLPYPDALLLAFHDWIDAKYPAPPTMIKIHGEFYFVLFVVDSAAWAACSFLGFHLGLLFGAVVPLGFRRRCGRIVALTMAASTKKST